MSETLGERVQPDPNADEETIRRQATIARSVTRMAHGLTHTPDPAGDMRFCARCFEALAEMHEEDQKGAE